MKIDETGLLRALEKAEAIGWHFDEAGELGEIIAAYLDTLPPKNDRIAVVINEHGVGTADVMVSDDFDWNQIEDAACEFGHEGPFIRQMVRCVLERPSGQVPIEVGGEVEEAP